MRSSNNINNPFNSSIQANNFAQTGQLFPLTEFSLLFSSVIKRLGKPAMFMLLGFLLLPAALIGTIRAQNEPPLAPSPVIEQADNNSIEHKEKKNIFSSVTEDAFSFNLENRLTTPIQSTYVDFVDTFITKINSNSLSITELVTFATFSSKFGEQDFVFTNNNPVSNFQTVTGGSQVNFLYNNIAGLPAELQGQQSARVFFSCQTSEVSFVTVGTTTQPFNNTCTIQVIRDFPASFGNGSRTNLLSASIVNTPTRSDLFGNSGGNSAQYNASTPNQVVTFSSDFLSFGASQSRNLNLSFSSIIPNLSQNNANGFLNSFSALGTGSFVSDPAPTPQTTAYSISGNITKNGVGLGGVTVTLNPFNPPLSENKNSNAAASPSVTVLTNDNGDYTFNFANSPNNQYEVQPTLANHTFNPPNRLVTMTTPNVTGVNFTGISTTSSISGRVTTSNGAGLGGVTMTLTTVFINPQVSGETSSAGGSPGVTVTTNDNGDYTFNDVSPSFYQYRVEPTLANYTFNPQSRTVSFNSNNPVDVTGVNFTGFPTIHSISGRVTTNNEVGLNGVVVNLSGGNSVTTSDGGYYSFTNVPAGGNYTVTPTHADYTFEPTQQSFSNLNENKNNVNFTGTLKRYSISGRVTDGQTNIGVPGVNISVQGISTIFPVTTNANGEYTFPAQPNGTYTVTPSQAGRTFTPVSQSVTINNSGATANFQRNSLTPSISNLNPSQRVAGSPEFNLTISGSNFAQDATVLFGNQNKTPISVTDTTIQVKIIAADIATVGDRSIQVVNPGAGGGPSNTLIFKVVNKPSISGRVINNNGVGLGEVTMTLTSIAQSSVSGVGSKAIAASPNVTVTTDSNGDYVFKDVLPSNSQYLVTPTRTNYRFNLPNQQVTISPENPVDVTGVNFTGTPISYSISGRVTDTNGDPVSGVLISSDGVPGATTNSNGVYTIENQLPGSHTISAFLQGATFGNITVVVADRNVDNVNFTLNCSYQLSSHSIAVPSSGIQDGSFSVTSTCRWSASVSSLTSWITATGSSTGNGTVRFTVGSNNGGLRAGSISVGNQLFNISQSPSQANCVFSLSPTSVNVPSAGGSGSFKVITTQGCQVGVPAIQGSGIRNIGVTPTNQVNFEVESSGPSRIIKILIQGRVFTIYQTNSEAIPLNDDFERAETLTENEVIANNAKATEQSNEPEHAGQPGNHSIWYKWKPVASGTYSFTTSGSISNQINQQHNSIDTMLAIYEDKPLSLAIPLVAANDDATINFDKGSNLTFEAEAGKTYLIAVDGKGNSSSNTGVIKLRWKKVTHLYRFYGLTGNGYVSPQEPEVQVLKDGVVVPNVVDKAAPGIFEVDLPNDNATYRVKFIGGNTNVSWLPVEGRPIDNIATTNSSSSAMKIPAGESVMNPQAGSTNYFRAEASGFHVIGQVKEIDDSIDLIVERSQNGPFPTKPTANCSVFPKQNEAEYVCETLVDTDHVFTAIKPGTGFTPPNILFSNIAQHIYPSASNFTASPQDNGGIEGIVKLNGQDLAGVRVKLEKNGEFYNATISNEGGNFTFRGVEVGTYTLSGEHNAYMFDPETVTVKKGEISSGIILKGNNGNCIFKVSNDGIINTGIDEGSESFVVTTNSAGCVWSMEVYEDWIEFTSHTNGNTTSATTNLTGTNTVTFTVKRNLNQDLRAAKIYINGKHEATVTQSGLISCVFDFNNKEDDYINAKGDNDQGGDTFSFKFTPSHQACRGINPSTTETAWITDLKNQGNEITYKVKPNNDPDPRIGKITFGRSVLTVIQAVETNKLPVGFDFTNDKKADISVYRPSNGTWYMLDTLDNTKFTVNQWGIATDTIVPGDYDGDGKLDHAVWRETCDFANVNTPCLLINNSIDNTIRVQVITKAKAGDIPMVGDWNNDKKADVVYYRPSEGKWYTLQSDIGIKIGEPHNTPVAGDFNGDRRQDYAEFNKSERTWLIKHSSGSEVQVKQFGLVGDIPTPADFDGDGKTDIAVYRPSEGNWYILRSAFSNSGYIVIRFGLAGDTPIAGDFDGDGRADVAVYRAGTWYILRSKDGFYGVQFGLPNDKPIPSAFIR